MKPVLAISSGDPAGIGPEIVAATLTYACTHSRPVIFGHWPTFKEALKRCNLIHLPIKRVDTPAQEKNGTIQFVHSGPEDEPITAPNEKAAVVQFESLKKSVDAILNGSCDAIATAPVSKSVVSMISPGFIGHTEYLASRCNLNDDDVTMVFASDKLTVGLVATHLPLAEIPQTITKARYLRTLTHVIETVKGLSNTPCPKIAVAALNPHGGEDGLLGSEEIDIIEPFCRAFNSQNDAIVVGPLPADTVFRDAFAGQYDGVVSAYHDQAMIPLKLNGFGATVNITMGLPFIRTSPDHGVAYDLARQNKANPAGMQKAIEMAVQLWRNDPTR